MPSLMKTDIKRLQSVVLIMLTLVLSVTSMKSTATTTVVKVGAGIRPPFLIYKHSGMGPEIISALNLVQDKFTFELVPVPISRRVQSLNDGWVDIVMWDNIHWGWDGMTLTVSKPILRSKDVFISHAHPEKSQAFFNDFTGKRICGVSGYHYKFLGFETNYHAVKDRFNIRLVRTEEESIEMAMQKRCDISVVSESALNWFFKLFPHTRNDMLVSTIYDTQYTRNFLLPLNAPITANEIDSIVNQASEQGLLVPIYEKYGQSLPIEK